MILVKTKIHKPNTIKTTQEIIIVSTFKKIKNAENILFYYQKKDYKTYICISKKGVYRNIIEYDNILLNELDS